MLDWIILVSLILSHMRTKAKDKGEKPSEQEQGPTDERRIHIIPTRHFERRLLERTKDFESLLPLRKTISASGSIVDSRRPNTYYLDVAGVGRYVLARRGTRMIGITVLPGFPRRTEVS